MNAGDHGSVVGIESVTVRYGRNVALRDVSLRVAPGEVYALLGRNGSGKSSLVRCLLGHQKPARGRTRLFGRDSWKRRKELMLRIGVVPEEPDAPPALTARQLARFCSRLYPRWDADGFRARLDRFDVPLGIPFGRLSKGQKGQVMLALALAPGPELLVLDDPTLGLDAVARKTVFGELIGELADRGITIFLTSHDLQGIERVAARIGLLRGGELVVDEGLELLKARCRRLVWRGRATPASRADRSSPPGSEIVAAMAPLAVETVGARPSWEGVVTRYSEAGFERLRAASEVEYAETSPLSLEEIVIALTQNGSGGEP